MTLIQRAALAAIATTTEQKIRGGDRTADWVLIANGYDADFLLWSGDPLDLTSRLTAVFVDGERLARHVDALSGLALDVDADRALVDAAVAGALARAKGALPS